MVPAAVGHEFDAFKGRPACISDGWCTSAARSARLPTRVVTYLGDARKAGAKILANRRPRAC